jgi:hypothetical protein
MVKNIRAFADCCTKGFWLQWDWRENVATLRGLKVEEMESPPPSGVYLEESSELLETKGVALGERTRVRKAGKQRGWLGDTSKGPQIGKSGRRGRHESV